MNNFSDINDAAESASGPAGDDDRGARRRLRGFAIHMAVFFVVIIALAVANFLYWPGDWWFVFPMVLWGAPLAVHAAYAMGLFRAFR